MSTRNTQHYDVIIAGARCAGAATALLLARQGARVLVLDKSRYGTDTLSTHALMRGAVLQLHRWGLLPAVAGAGTPPVRSTTFHLAKTMVSLGYIRQEKDSKRYRVGRPLFALAASAFATPAIIGGRRLKVAATLAYDEFLNTLNWPLGAAIAILLLIANIVIIVGCNRLLERRYAEVFR